MTAEVRTRPISNVLAVIATGIGGVAAITWWVNGRLSTVGLIAVCVGTYGLGVVSARAISSPLVMRMKKGLKAKSGNKLNDGEEPSVGDH